MSKLLPIAQIVISLLLIIVVLLQNREGGVSGVLGGEGVGGSFYTKRGLEKGLMYATVILAFLFVLSAALSFILK